MLISDDKASLSREQINDMSLTDTCSRRTRLLFWLLIYKFKVDLIPICLRITLSIQ